MVVSTLFSALATIAFAVLNQAPRRAILPSGVLGAVAWLLLNGAIKNGVDVIAANFFASLVVSLFSEAFARHYRMPVPVFAVPGIIVLVPGMDAYFAMKDFVTHHYLNGISMATETMLIAGAISTGLVIAGVLMRSIWRPRRDDTR